MKEEEPYIRDKSIDRYFSLWKGERQLYSTLKNTIVQSAVDTLLKEGRIISQTVITDHGQDELIFFPDYEERKKRFNILKI